MKMAFWGKKLAFNPIPNDKNILICAKQILYNKLFLMYNDVVWGLDPIRTYIYCKRSNF